MNKAKRFAAAVIALLTVVAVLAPSAALAAPGPGPSGTTSGAENVDQLKARLRSGIEEALRNRAQRFENAANRIETRTRKVAALADKVEGLGGDVEAVREMLQECERLMVQAREQERLAVQMFQGVPDSQNRRQAFTQARNQARNAVQTMNEARVQLMEATRELRGVVQELQED